MVKHGQIKDIFKKILIFQIFNDRTQYYSDEFKKMRCKIQECRNYQRCRVFIQNILAVQLLMTAK